MRKWIITVLSVLCALTPLLAYTAQPTLPFHIKKSSYSVYLMLPEAQTEVAVQALLTWNTALGRELFKLAKKPEKADIVLHMSPAMQYGNSVVAGVTYWLGASKSAVMISDEFSLSPVVYVHELGHAVGLDHSDQKKSVMYPSVDTTKNVQGILNETIQALN